MYSLFLFAWQGHFGHLLNHDKRLLITLKQKTRKRLMGFTCNEEGNYRRKRHHNIMVGPTNHYGFLGLYCHKLIL